MTSKEELMLDPLPYDARHHNPGTLGESGRCSWHGRPTCAEMPVISFQDRDGAWQSGCQRALDELTGRGEMTRPAW